MLGLPPVFPRRSALQYCLVLLVSSVDPPEACRALCLNTDHFASSLLATLHTNALGTCTFHKHGRPFTFVEPGALTSRGKDSFGEHTAKVER